MIRAAEAALARRQYVSAIDVLTGMGLLTPSHVESWRKGRIDFLERVIHGNLKKISASMATFRRWAREKGLQPSETRYVRKTRVGSVDLQFSKSGNPGIEKLYRTHYISPALSERKRMQLVEKLNQAKKPVVFEVLRDSQCSECGVELPQGSFLFLEVEQALCLACARMNDLEYLPAGNHALTRRAAKYSGRTAVVVRFSRLRERYERQGILVEPAALEKAEDECALDADERAHERSVRAAAALEQDRHLAARMTGQIMKLFPGCSLEEAAAIGRHTSARGSGRMGRTAAGRNLDEQALTLSVTAAIRHRHTNYDSLLASGLDRVLARHEVADRVQGILQGWRNPN